MIRQDLHVNPEKSGKSCKNVLPVKEEPWILGISASHNGSACLLKGDEIVVAIQEERLSRFKRQRIHGAGPERAREYEALASSVQKALEAALLFLGQHLRELCSSVNFCYAGGVALNSVANERIIRESGFRNVYIMPAAEDSGTAVGCLSWTVATHATQFSATNTARCTRKNLFARRRVCGAG